MCLPVLRHPRVKRRHAGVPGLAGGHAAGVEAVQVAAGRQAFGVAHRVAAVAGLDVPAVQRGQKAGNFLVVGQRSIELLRPQGQGQQDLRLKHLGLGAVGHGTVGA